MNAFVLDCSATMTWCFEDEASGDSDRLLHTLIDAEAVVPAIWALEVVNVITLARKAGRIDEAGAREFLRLLESMPITVDETSLAVAFGDVRRLADTTGLSSYDAAYLELALRHNLPLATRDEALRATARKRKVALLPV